MAATLDAPIQHTFLAVGIVLLILTALVTGFRFYSRRISQVAYGLDDWLALAAIVFFWAEIAFHFYGPFASRHLPLVLANTHARLVFWRRWIAHKRSVRG